MAGPITTRDAMELLKERYGQAAPDVDREGTEAAAGLNALLRAWGRAKPGLGESIKEPLRQPKTAPP